tara:strand:+ start:1407 stop:1628 length:222 start_codon:yes stop_codon:yes gene_type:complete
MIVSLEKGRNLMKHGDKEMKRSGMMYGGMREKNMMGGMREKKTHGGAHAANPAPSQPTYGDTVETAMNKAGPN